MNSDSLDRLACLWSLGASEMAGFAVVRSYRFPLQSQIYPIGDWNKYKWMNELFTIDSCSFLINLNWSCDQVFSLGEGRGESKRKKQTKQYKEGENKRTNEVMSCLEGKNVEPVEVEVWDGCSMELWIRCRCLSRTFVLACRLILASFRVDECWFVALLRRRVQAIRELGLRDDVAFLQCFARRLSRWEHAVIDVVSRFWTSFLDSNEITSIFIVCMRSFRFLTRSFANNNNISTDLRNIWVIWVVESKKYFTNTVIWIAILHVNVFRGCVSK